MTSAGTAATAVLVATRNRVELLQRLLRSLEREAQSSAESIEIVVADNGSSDGTPSMLAAWAGAGSGRKSVRVDEPGKSRALNRALAATNAPLLAFVDDDEEVADGWLDALLRFCAEHPEYAAATGRVLPPPDCTDPRLRELMSWYGTIAFFDGGDAVHDKQAIYGGNMVLR
ncbi:MAG TPA: glycosyltransferase family A protein, partial [Candidatus Acidoferrales bacterium]|nr:glycosyltransferase family A protein [Candidatus Acidoferrales bacterium]